MKQELIKEVNKYRSKIDSIKEKLNQIEKR